MTRERDSSQTDREQDSSQPTPQPDTLPFSGLPDMDDSEVGHIEGVMRREMMMGMGPMIHPLADKITSEHITSMIDHSREESALESSESRHARTSYLLFVVGVIFLLGTLVVVLVLLDESPLVQTLLCLLGGLAAGGFGGYGIGKAQSSR